LHSVRNDLTGFSIADFIVRILKISIAINNIPAPVAPNTHQLNEVRYTKSCNQLFITHQATGKAIKKATNTNAIKSFDSKATICVMEAPNTFLTPISFVRLLVIYITKPSKPRQLIKMHKPAD